jgi:hypothetical protein
MSSPPHPFSFLSFFLCPLSLVRPRRRLSPAPTAYCRGRRAQMAVKAGRSSAATPPGLRPLQQSSTTADLMVGSITTPVRYLSVFVSARALFRSRMLLSAGLLRGPWRVRCSHQLISGSSDPACQGAACMDDRAGGMGLIFGTADRQVPICDWVLQPHIRPARHTRDWGVGTQRSFDVIA